MSILLENVRHDGEKTDILIDGNRIDTIGDIDPDRREHVETRLDGERCLAMPGLMNSHTHAAMTLFRGYGDDLPLQEWLEQKIWPAEDKLTEDDVYWGTRLACLEMIRTGTTFLNEMYWHFHGACRAISDSGLRAMVSAVFIDHFEEKKAREQQERNQEYYREVDQYPDRIQFTVGPHSVYTVSPESLEWAGTFSKENNVPLHIHAAETEQEVKECEEQHNRRPIAYLDELGVLHEDTVLAHGLWLSDQDIERIGESGAAVVHNPLPNYKMASGCHFRYRELREAGVPVLLGTDGPASNSNLNLFEEVKMAALTQKVLQGDASTLPAEEALALATVEPASFFHLDVGTLEEGNLADLVLLDPDHPSLVPLHNEASVVAYASGGMAVDTVICDGNILMENRNIEGEEEVLREVRERAKRIVE